MQSSMIAGITRLVFLFPSYSLCFLHVHNSPKREEHIKKFLIKLTKGLLEKKEREEIIYTIGIIYIFQIVIIEIE